MTQTQSRPKAKITRGKYENLLALSDEKGTIRAAATAAWERGATEQPHTPRRGRA